MKRSRFSEHQIIAILKAVEAGRSVKDVWRQNEVSEGIYYKWKSKYGGMRHRTSSGCVTWKKKTGN